MTKAIDALARIGPEAAPSVSSLIELFKHKINIDRHPERFLGLNGALVNALSSIGRAAVPGLVSAVKDPNPRVRYKAFRTLRELGLPTNAAIATLCKALTDSDRWVRSEAAQALRKFGPVAFASIPFLTDALDDPDLFVRTNADYALLEIKPDHQLASSSIVSSLIKSLKDQDLKVRAKAAEILASIGPEAQAAVPALMSSLKDDWNSYMPLEVVNTHGLIARTDKTILTDLIASLNDKNCIVCNSAALAIAEIGQEARAAIPNLIRILEISEWPARQGALLALAAIGRDAKVAMPAIIELLKCHHNLVSCPDLYDLKSGERSTAALALGRIGAAEKDVAIRALIQALQDPDEEVREEVVCSLRQLAPDLNKEVISRSDLPYPLCPLVHVPRKTKTDCGIAAVAMITGVPYDEVVANTSDRVQRRAMHCNELLALLHKLTGTKWQM